MARLSEIALSVTQLNDYIKNLLGEDLLLRGLTLVGEISGLRRHSSGHMYFAVKDEQSVMRCVMFRQSAFSLRFRPEDGMRVQLTGYVSYYTRDGALQFYCEGMQPDGVGALYLAFEQLKAKLAAEGLFEAARKRPLPALPRRLAVVTSPTGAAVRDVIRVAGRRHPGLDIVVVPAIVQGNDAPASIVRALKAAAALDRVDVIVCGRGGGSIEDLWCFNDEGVARAIAACPVPVVSGVGHETDFTIADFVADVRAATPSQAAEIIVPDVSAMIERRIGAELRMREAVLRQLRGYAERLARVSSSRVLSRPGALLAPMLDKQRTLWLRLHGAVRPSLALREARLRAAKQALSALNPAAVLERGYSIVTQDDGRVVTSPAQILGGEMMSIRTAGGAFAARREG